MKAVYRSIKPYWLFLILIGKKTIEVGKTFPKADDWNKEVFLHCSKDMKSFKRIPEKDREWMQKYLGKVACRFVCDKIYGITSHFDTPTYPNQYICGWDYGKEFDCLSFEELTSYLNGKEGYGWHISDLVIYDKPRKLTDFRYHCRYEFDDDYKHCEGCYYYYYSNTPSYGIEEYCGCDGLKMLRKPPQSWMYVEVA